MNYKSIKKLVELFIKEKKSREEIAVFFLKNELCLNNRKRIFALKLIFNVKKELNHAN